MRGTEPTLPPLVMSYKRDMQHVGPDTVREDPFREHVKETMLLPCIAMSRLPNATLSSTAHTSEFQ
jgi:hypothetical protein